MDTSKNAYVLFTADASDPRRREFFISGLVAALSIQKALTTPVDIVMLVFGDLASADIALILAMGLKLRFVEGVGAPVTGDFAKEDNRTREIYRAHLRAIQLIEYHAIISLDSDIVIMRDLATLFDLDDVWFGVKACFVMPEEPGGPGDCPVAPINTGFWLTHPSCDDFNGINDVAKSDTWSPEDGWMGHGMFADWRTDYEGEWHIGGFIRPAPIKAYCSIISFSTNKNQLCGHTTSRC